MFNCQPSSTTSHYYDDLTFRKKIQEALLAVKNILDTTRTPCHAADDDDHTYDDKYGLAEFLTNICMAAQFNVLIRLGMVEDKLKHFSKCVLEDKTSVTLRFEAKETCCLLKEEVITITDPSQHNVTEEKETDEYTTKTTIQTKKVMNTIKEYHWSVGLQYSLYAFSGNNSSPSSRIELHQRQSSCEIVTTGNKEPPLPTEVIHRDPMDVSLTWLFQNASSDNLTCSFAIDRSATSCRTPRRNEDMTAAFDFFETMMRWCTLVKDYFIGVERFVLSKSHASRQEHQGQYVHTTLEMLVGTKGIFLPVLPLFESPLSGNGSTGHDEVTTMTTEESTTRGGDGETTAESDLVPFSLRRSSESHSPLLPISDVNLFLKEQCTTLDKKAAELSDLFPPDDSTKLICVSESFVVLLTKHCIDVVNLYLQSIDSIEFMIHTQLIKAIGKVVTDADFRAYMRHHDRKIYKDSFAPAPFCYAIRRPNHYPDGVLSIEERDDDREAITTFTRRIDGNNFPPMLIPINSATSVAFDGDRYLHGWLLHKFGHDSSPRFATTAASHELLARARQFSCFLVLLGRISGPEGFDPTHAVIVQDKDEIRIPLCLEDLPSPKEFKDAIKSLSPNQQRFAKAYREMQLSTSVFGVCVIQLKPQLEVLLGLPKDALTKEIRLTRDLLSLFIDYQIPSDLLSFDGDEETASVAEKVTVVKGHAAAVREIIEEEKTKQLEEEKQRKEMAKALQPCENEGGFGYSPGPRMMFRGAGGPPPPPPPSGMGYFGSCAPAPAPAPVASNAVTSVRRCLASAEVVYDYEECEIDEVGHLDDDDGPDITTFEKKEYSNNILSETSSESKALDFTKIPKRLESKFETLDDNESTTTNMTTIKPTTIKPSDPWSKSFSKNLLAKKMEQITLDASDQTREKQKAFDLLDALSKGGSLPLTNGELHVIVACRHRFDESLVNTVVRDNLNPIEIVERSGLVMASVVHDVAVSELRR